MSGWTQRCSSSGISNVCRGVPRSSARRNWSGSGSSSIRRCCVRQKYRYRKNVGSPPVFDAFTVRWTICVSGYFNLVRLSTCFFDTDASFRLLYRYLHTIGPKNIRTFRAFNCICNFLFQNFLFLFVKNWKVNRVSQQYGILSMNDTVKSKVGQIYFWDQVWIYIHEKLILYLLLLIYPLIFISVLKVRNKYSKKKKEEKIRINLR